MQETMYEKLLLLPLFQGLCMEDLTAIIEKVKLHFTKYKPGEYLVRQNETSGSLIFIIQGKICSEAVDSHNRYTLYETLDAPTVLEAYSLLGMHPQYTASYAALTEVSSVTVDKAAVLSELNQYEIFRLNYLNLLSNRAQTLHHKLWNTYSGTTWQKIVHFLQLRCTRPVGEKKLFIRMEDLATFIDDTRINVSKTLNEMQNRGLLTLSRKAIQIPHLEKLSAQSPR